MKLQGQSDSRLKGYSRKLCMAFKNSKTMFGLCIIVKNLRWRESICKIFMSFIISK